MQSLGARSSNAQVAALSRRVHVVVGLAGGTEVRGWLRVPGAWGVADLLNNVREPVLTLDSAPDGQSGSVVVTRSNAAWIGALGPEPASNGEQHGGGSHCERSVVVHVGPFEVRGMIRTQADVQWSNFLVGRSGPPAEFVPLANARVAACPELMFPMVAVNVALVGALLD
jgi:hypothetical protein